MTHKTRIVALALLTGIAATGLIAVAGDLNPPVGPIAPTHKTLTEVEPRTAINATNTPGDADSLFKITQPGSYYLTGNITGVIGKHGIEIVAIGVTLDLNGFELTGVPGMGAFDGVSVTVASVRNIAVVNGSVRNWGEDGIDLYTSAAHNCRVEGVLASANAGDGILAGEASTVSNCAAYLNAGSGIKTRSGCTVSNCSAYLNTGIGISTGFGDMVSNCSAYQNGSTGIFTSNAGTVVACLAYGNTGNGITSLFGGVVSNCTAYQNTANGISCNDGCTVADCSARSNTLDGIVCDDACMIRGNTCSNNGNGAGDGAGIHATGDDNRIEGNNSTGADRGIDVDAAGNIIIKNTCAGNTTNWDIVANNVCGPILDRTAPASAAILGNSAPDSTGSTHPNANFTY